jgi:two-component system phosphate regulon response regulator PhoB
MLQSEGNLLVIGHDDLSFLLKHILESDGHKTAVSPSIEGALDSVRLDSFDLIILDESLLTAPGHHASCYCDLVRQWTAPLLILASDRYAALHAAHMSPGQAIDVIPKPISPDELLRRVRGAPGVGQEQPALATLVFADVELNARTQRIYRNGRPVCVTPLEFRLLHHLMKSPGEVFSREAILKAAWPRDVFVEPRTVDVHMGKLRKSLNQHGEPNLIRTVHSRGYSLDLED